MKKVPGRRPKLPGSFFVIFPACAAFLKGVSPLPNLKRIPLQGAHNFRDLGGYPTADGRCTRWGLLYRSDALSALSRADWTLLLRRGIKTVIDLRSLPEAQAAPLSPPEGVQALHFSLMQELDGALPGPGTGEKRVLDSMLLDYKNMLFGSLPCCAGILRAIAGRLDAGSVVFMCSAGKDRTGIIAAVLLYLCGVPREDIVADYMVSSTYNANGFNRKLSSIPQSIRALIPDPAMLQSCLASQPETISTLLDELDRRDFRTLLEGAGFSLKQQELLTAALTEPL